MISKHAFGWQQQNIHGFLRHRSEWTENVALQIAEKEGIALTDRHWDVIYFIRTEFYVNNGQVPGESEIRSGMEREWKAPLSMTDLNILFPGGSHTQGAKIAGCITVRTVSDLLAVKGDVVWSINSDQLVLEALRLFAEKNIGALMVVDNDRLIGIVSERDFTRSVVLNDRLNTDTPVRSIMSSEVVSVEPENTLERCMAIMTDRGFRHLPVLEQGRLVGVLSMPDLVKVIVDQQRFTISQLKRRRDRALLEIN